MPLMETLIVALVLYGTWLMLIFSPLTWEHTAKLPVVEQAPNDQSVTDR